MSDSPPAIPPQSPARVSSRRLEFWLLGIAVLAVAASAGLTWWNIDEDRELTRANTVRIADALANSIGEHLGETLRDGLNAAYSAAVLIENNGAFKPGTDPDWLHRELNRELVDNLSIARLLAVDAKGRVIASSAEEGLAPISMAADPNLQWHLAHPAERGLHLGVSRKSPVSGAMAIPYSRAVYGPGGVVAGMVVAEIDMAHLRLFHERLTGKSVGALAVIDPDGLRLMRLPYDESLIGKRVGERIPVARLFEGDGDFETVNAIDGHTYYYAHRLIRDPRLVVVVGLDKDQALAPWLARSRQRAAIVGAGSLMFLALCVLFVSYLRRLERSERRVRLRDAQLRTLSNNLPNGMIYQILLEPGGERRFTYVSAGVERHNGVTAEAVLADPGVLYRQIVPEDLPRVREAEKVSLQTLGVFDQVVRLRRADGALRWMHLWSAPRRLADGGVLWDGMQIDITETRTASEALEQSEERFRSAMVNSASGIGLLAIDGRWLEVNPALCEILGRSREEMIGQTARSMTHPDELDRQRELVQGTLAGSIDSYQFEKRYLRPDGSVVWAYTVVSLVREPGGAPSYFISQVQDISARRQAEEDIRRLNADLERRVAERTSELTAANHELDAFAASVSHDLRAPVRRISGFAGMLLEAAGELPPDAAKSLQVITRETERMNRMIDDLLMLARVGRTEIKRADCDLAELVAAVRAELAPDCAGREIEWRIDPLPVVRGDRGLLQQALANLIGNAVKYSRGRAPAQIHIGTDPAQAQEGEIVVFVRDNGVGFDMRYAGKLFGVFQRLHRPDQFEGTGIGLVNVRRIITRHGGRTWADSQPDAGATFYFSLPR